MLQFDKCLLKPKRREGKRENRKEGGREEWKMPHSPAEEMGRQLVPSGLQVPGA